MDGYHLLAVLILLVLIIIMIFRIALRGWLLLHSRLDVCLCLPESLAATWRTRPKGLRFLTYLPAKKSCAAVCFDPTATVAVSSQHLMIGNHGISPWRPS